jgi:hypothetical protein
VRFLNITPVLANGEDELKALCIAENDLLMAILETEKELKTANSVHAERIKREFTQRKESVNMNAYYDKYGILVSPFDISVITKSSRAFPVKPFVRFFTEIQVGQFKYMILENVDRVISAIQSIMEQLNSGYAHERSIIPATSASINQEIKSKYLRK